MVQSNILFGPIVNSQTSLTDNEVAAAVPILQQVWPLFAGTAGTVNAYGLKDFIISVFTGEIRTLCMQHNLTMIFTITVVN